MKNKAIGVGKLETEPTGKEVQEHSEAENTIQINNVCWEKGHLQI